MCHQQWSQIQLNNRISLAISLGGSLESAGREHHPAPSHHGHHAEIGAWFRERILECLSSIPRGTGTSFWPTPFFQNGKVLGGPKWGNAVHPLWKASATPRLLEFLEMAHTRWDWNGSVQLAPAQLLSKQRPLHAPGMHPSSVSWTPHHLCKEKAISRMWLKRLFVASTKSRAIFRALGKSSRIEPSTASNCHLWKASHHFQRQCLFCRQRHRTCHGRLTVAGVGEKDLHHIHQWSWHLASNGGRRRSPPRGYRKHCETAPWGAREAHQKCISPWKRTIFRPPTLSGESAQRQERLSKLQVRYHGTSAAQHWIESWKICGTASPLPLLSRQQLSQAFCQDVGPWPWQPSILPSLAVTVGHHQLRRLCQGELFSPLTWRQLYRMVCTVPSESHTDSILLGKRKQQGHKGPLGQLDKTSSHVWTNKLRRSAE